MVENVTGNILLQFRNDDSVALNELATTDADCGDSWQKSLGRDGGFLSAGEGGGQVRWCRAQTPDGGGWEEGEEGVGGGWLHHVTRSAVRR